MRLFWVRAKFKSRSFLKDKVILKVLLKNYLPVYKWIMKIWNCINQILVKVINQLKCPWLLKKLINFHLINLFKYKNISISSKINQLMLKNKFSKLNNNWRILIKMLFKMHSKSIFIIFLKYVQQILFENMKKMKIK